jgi:hypothetical protein
VLSQRVTSKLKSQVKVVIIGLKSRGLSFTHTMLSRGGIHHPLYIGMQSITHMMAILVQVIAQCTIYIFSRHVILFLTRQFAVDDSSALVRSRIVSSDTAIIFFSAVRGPATGVQRVSATAASGKEQELPR